MKTHPTLCRIFLFSCLCCTLTVARAQYVAIPDLNFGNWLYLNGYDLCMTGNSVVGWQLDINCAGGVALTTMNCGGNNIQDLTGVEYFTALQELNCENNNLTTLPALPPSLQRINCRFNLITDIPAVVLPNTLTDLDCSFNGLDSLPNLQYSSLTSLTCDYNTLTYLPPLPYSLVTLYCISNQLDSLPDPLPGSLYNFYCDNNHIRTMPPFPSSLANINCSSNLLSSIPALPSHLYNLDCSYNSITSLPALPQFMYTLDCGHNFIRTIPTLPTLNFTSLKFAYDTLSAMPTLPAGLSTLDCSYSNIGTLPTLPAALNILRCDGANLSAMPTLNSNLRYLYCSHNHLTSLPTLPGSITDLQCDSNPQLACLPYIRPNLINNLYISGTAITCLPNRFSSNHADVALANYPLCDATSGCDFYYNIAGNIHYDNSASCAGDSLIPGPPITNMKVRLKQGGNVIQQFYTFGSGGYSFRSPSYGSYTIDIDTTALPLAVACPQSGVRNVTISAIDSVKKFESFGMLCSGFDFGVSSMAGSRFRPAFQTTVFISGGNIALLQYNANCGSGSGTVTTTLDNATHYIGPAPGALTPSSISGNILTYNIANISTLHAGSIDFILSTDAAAALGSQVCITTSITTALTDAVPSNNSLTECFTVRNSYDPNHKDVYPATILAGAADWLTYTIHFQNTGSDTAYLVVLKDTLSNFVDASSFQYLASSHHAVIQLDHNAMAFTFPHIDLVDSATNPPLSEGWIQYRVKANPALPVGTAIDNKAYIYFDNNPAIVTNTATTNVTLATCSDTTISVSQSICAGDTFSFYGQHLTAQGTYADTMARAGGCDSIISLTLTVHTRYIAQVAHDTICDGSVLSYHGQALTAAGTYTATLQSVFGCDSLVSVALAVRPMDMTMIEDTICSGSSYTFYGQSLTAAGMYMDTLTNIHGCDSVIMLMLEVRASDTTRRADTICSGSSYAFYGRTLTAAGTYTDTLHNAQGCDSLIVLSLAVRAAPVVTWTQTDTVFCLGDVASFWWLRMTGFSPAGGTFSTPLVHNDTLYPLVRDTNLFIQYSYVDNNGCSGSAGKTFIITLCLGTEDIAGTENISLYPNPNTGIFTLQTSNSKRNTYIITNMLGEVIEEKTITSDAQAIDMRSAAAGVYTLSVKGHQSVRFVVVR